MTCSNRSLFSHKFGCQKSEIQASVDSGGWGESIRSLFQPLVAAGTPKLMAVSPQYRLHLHTSFSSARLSFKEIFTSLFISVVYHWLSGKEPACQAGDMGSVPGSERRKQQPIPVFLPGKFHGQRSLAGYSLWGLKRVRHDLVTK